MLFFYKKNRYREKRAKHIPREKLRLKFPLVLLKKKKYTFVLFLKHHQTPPACNYHFFFDFSFSSPFWLLLPLKSRKANLCLISRVFVLLLVQMAFSTLLRSTPAAPLIEASRSDFSPSPSDRFEVSVLFSLINTFFLKGCR